MAGQPRGWLPDAGPPDPAYPRQPAGGRPSASCSAVVEPIRTSKEDQAVGHLGPDLLGPDWDAAGGGPQAHRPSSDRTIGEALLDQRNVAGIGTIYRAETLFLRGVNPWRKVGEVAGPAGTGRPGQGGCSTRTRRAVRRSRPASTARSAPRSGSPRPGGANQRAPSPATTIMRGESGTGARGADRGLVPALPARLRLPQH